MLVPLFTLWYALAFIRKRQYKLLWIITFAICIPVFVLSYFYPRVTTWYGGPLAATGIATIQIPIAIITTMLILMIKSGKRSTRLIIYSAALIISEVLLINIWVA